MRRYMKCPEGHKQYDEITLAIDKPFRKSFSFRCCKCSDKAGVDTYYSYRHWTLETPAEVLVKEVRRARTV